MDFNKLKVYGFPRHMLKYNVYNPMKIRYLKCKTHGYFEAPKVNKIPELRFLVDRYKQRIEYEKYMNPKGFKTTWTSNFPKIGDTIDYVDPKIYLVRSEKRYGPNEAKFLIDNDLSKLEVKQFLEKLYKVKVKKINTAIMPGKVKADPEPRGQMKYTRTKDRKKAVVKFDFNVDEKYREVERKN